MFLSELGFYFLTFVIVIWSVQNPFAGILGYYTFSFFRPQDVYWYALADTRLSFYIATVTIFSAIMHSKNREPGVKTVNATVYFFILFFLATFNSYFFSVNMENSYPWMILLVKLIVMSLMTLMVVDNIKKLRILLLMPVFVFGYLAFNANYEYFFLNVWQVVAPGIPEVSGSLDNNGFAMEFVLVIPIAYFLFFTESSLFLKWFPPSTIPFIIHTVILTYSRGGFLGMGVVLLNCVVYLKHRKWAVLTAIVFLMIVFRLQGEMSKQRIETVLEYEEDPSAQSRFDSWQAGLNMMVDKGLSGVGIGNFEVQAPTYNFNIIQPKAAHNAFLHIGGEMGFPGFALYIFIYFYSFLKLWAIRKYYKPRYRETPHYYYATALQVSLIGFFVCSMFLSLNYLELYYFLLALIGCFINICNRDKEIYENPA